MSAKEHYRPKPIDLPDLPPEIWLSIFRFATWSTGIFNPQLMIFTGCDTLYREQLREFKRSLVTKRYLVRVCKAWYYLASPFLFEYIFLGRGKVLAPLRDGLLRSEELNHTVRWRTQRLDVSMRDRTDNPSLIMDILADILRRLPNLRILTFAIMGHGYTTSRVSYYIPENVLQATSACRDTLQFLNWYGGLMPSSNGPSWASFLDNHPQLEALNAPVVLPQFGNSHIVLNSLKSVYVYCYSDPSGSRTENGFWNIDLPNIHHAIYDTSWTNITSGSTFDAQNNFLNNIAPNLTSIQINCLKPRAIHDTDFYAIYFGFQRIFDACENVARVDFVTYEWRMQTFYTFPKTAHILGIRVVNAYQISKYAMQVFFDRIHDSLSCLPFLKTVCFTDPGNIRALHTHPQILSSSIARIMSLGVDVMDHEGRPLL